MRLAFVAALQHLPARQRAVLILREVLHWKAGEVAELLETTVASVNSALQRARATLAENTDPRPGRSTAGRRAAAAAGPYVDAFERYDMAELVTLLHDDAVLSMPPYELWLHGRRTSRLVARTGHAAAGLELIPLMANGMPAFAQYRPDPAGGYPGWALQVLEISGARSASSTPFWTPRRCSRCSGCRSGWTRRDGRSRTDEFPA